jgi:diguanylate cyclase (GGDEF)-like protein
MMEQCNQKGRGLGVQIALTYLSFLRRKALIGLAVFNFYFFSFIFSSASAQLLPAENQKSSIASSAHYSQSLKIGRPNFDATQTHQWQEFAAPIFTSLSTHNGLPQFTATSFAQDRDHFIWVGTQGGLARWDGYRFRSYSPNANDPHSIPDNYVSQLRTDASGRLWVGFNSGGVAYYDPKKDHFVRLPIGNKGLNHATVNAIVDDGKNGIWIGTRAGLNHYDIQTGKFEYFVSDAKNSSTLPGNFIRALLRDQQGHLWVGTTDGLAKLDTITKKFIRFKLPLPAQALQKVRSLEQSKDGKIWIGTVDKGAFFLDPATQMIKPLLVKDSPTDTAHSTNDYIFTIAAVAEKEVWLGSYFTGIIVVNTENLETRRIVHEPNRPSSLYDNVIWNIFQDRAGLIWIGTQRGISLYNPVSHAVYTIFGEETSPRSLLGKDYLAVTQLSDGQIWAGSQKQGISMLKLGAKKFEYLRSDNSKPQSRLSESTIFEILEVSPDLIFVGTDRGLYQTNSKASAVQLVKIGNRDPLSRVNSLLHYQGKLWIGGEGGAWELDLSRPYSEQSVRPKWAESFLTKYVKEMLIGPDGALWVGTLHDGMIRVDLSNGQTTSYSPSEDKPYRIAHKNIGNMFFDSRKWLWVGTQGGGLDLIRMVDGQSTVVNIGKAQNLPNELVNKIVEDKHGKIWVSTDNGIVEIEPDTLHVRAYGEAEGVSILGYWSGSGVATAQGDLVFGGIGGLTVIRPSNLVEYEFQAPIVLTSLQVGGVNVAVNHSGFIGKQAEKVTIQPEANSLLMEFSALDYSNPDSNRYAYQLHGFDKNWTEVDFTKRFAAYTNLPPGDYQMQIRGTNRSGLWSSNELVIAVTVLPAWYQTKLAFSISLLILIGFIVAIVKWRLWRVNKEKKNLEILVTQRTQELLHSKHMLEEQSLTDHLTGLRNRRYLNLCIEKEITQVKQAYNVLVQAQYKREQQSIDMVFMMVDLDHFKSVNDTYGHAAGDVTITTTTNALRKAIRETDTIIRWGGEEFLIMARNTNFNEAVILAERIRSSVEQLAIELPDAQVLHKTCSIGFTNFPFIPNAIDAFTWEQVVDIADQCLYAAKRNGRNAWVGLLFVGDEADAQGINHSNLVIPDLVQKGKLQVATSLRNVDLDWGEPS